MSRLLRLTLGVFLAATSAEACARTGGQSPTGGCKASRAMSRHAELELRAERRSISPAAPPRC